MGTLVVLLLVAFAAWVGWKLWKKPDANDDGVVDHKDAMHAAKDTLDVNKDGKVDLADVKAAGEKVVEKAKKVRKKKAE
jgi:predicted negative regulator of RcsB-dependent stress response